MLRFRSWVLRFRVLDASFSILGASFSSFGCFVFEFWVLRASVFVFEFFVFDTTIDTLPKHGKKKLSMCVDPHDVYPTIDVNFSILKRECKNKKIVDNIFSQTLFCYQCVEL